MKTALFDYSLPKEKIAQTPLEKRDQSKLLLCQSAGRLGEFNDPFEFKVMGFSKIVDLLNKGDILILNNTKVLPVRLLGNRLLDDGSRGGTVEVLLLEKNPSLDLGWTALVHLSAKVKVGMRFYFHPDLIAECLSDVEERKQNHGKVRLRFHLADSQRLQQWLLKYGHVPLPPYIERNDNEVDKHSYQTVYAVTPGSAAAPTAGFHFTEELLKALREKNVIIDYVTLHVGLGTFKPIEADNIEDHPMHEETYEVSNSLSERLKEILELKKKNKNSNSESSAPRVVAVGTTVVRTLESWAQNGCNSGLDKTSIFIQPSYNFKVVDDLVTNFHMPRTTLLALIAAAMGYENMRQAYDIALASDFRFLSYGDAQFIRGRKGSLN